MGRKKRHNVDDSMDRYLAIATALADELPLFDPGREAVIEAPAMHTLCVLRSNPGTALRWRISEQPLGLTAAQEDAACEALARLGAETRWTQGYAGGLDPHSGLSVMATLSPDALAADQIATALDQLTGQLRQALHLASPGEGVTSIFLANQDQS